MDDIRTPGELGVFPGLARCLNTTGGATDLAFPCGFRTEVNQDRQFKVVTLFGFKVTIDFNRIRIRNRCRPTDLVTGFALNGRLQGMGVTTE